MNVLAELPPLSRAAFLLDLDGTLLDIAPTPSQVVVAPGLTCTLRTLRRLCGDALAIVTGRPIAQVDALLGDTPYAVAGEHGTAIRHEPGQPIRTLLLPHTPAHWTEAARVLIDQHPGALLEAKAHGFVLHYRAAPQASRALRDGLQTLLAEQPGAYTLMEAKMAWEIRPAGVDKGSAARTLMAAPPFRTRVPIFIGDDVTDEDGMREARAQGGIGLRVADVFGDAAGLRAWLAQFVATATGVIDGCRDAPSHAHSA